MGETDIWGKYIFGGISESCGEIAAVWELTLSLVLLVGHEARPIHPAGRRRLPIRLLAFVEDELEAAEVLDGGEGPALGAG